MTGQRLLIVDDHEVVGEGLETALRRLTNLTSFTHAPSVATADALLQSADFDLVIVDIRLQDGSGLELLDRARRRHDAPPFLVLSSFDIAQYVDAAMRLGASGFVLKTAPTGDILAAIERVLAGGTAFDAALVRKLAQGRWQQLGDREQAIVDGVLRGRSNDEIAAELGLSRKTIEAYLSKLYERFSVSSRGELAVKAERERWLDLPPAQ